MGKQQREKNLFEAASVRDIDQHLFSASTYACDFSLAEEWPVLVEIGARKGQRKLSRVYVFPISSCLGKTVQFPFDNGSEFRIPFREPDGNLSTLGEASRFDNNSFLRVDNLVDRRMTNGYVRHSESVQSRDAVEAEKLFNGSFVTLNRKICSDESFKLPTRWR